MNRRFGRRTDVDDEALAARAERFRDELDRGYPADPGAVDRVRPIVLASFRSMAPSPTHATRWSLVRRLRPAASLLLATSVMVGGAGVVVACSSPGDVFYPVRLALDSLSLPLPWGSSSALDRLQHRMDEARGEAGDPAGVSAALEAYRAELQRALAEAGTPAERQAVLEALDAHSLVLDELAGDTPEAAGPGLQEAIDGVGAARDSLRTQPPATPAAEPTPRPDRTSKPPASHGPPAR